MIERIQELLRLPTDDPLLRADALHIEGLDGRDLPDPYRALLDHESDMTGTLEAHWGLPLSLEVQQLVRDGDVLHRQVVLRAGERAVEYGTIRIELARYDERARARVLAGRRPLGGILTEGGIAHRCRPLLFFRRESDERTRAALGLDRPLYLYGRLARIETPAGEVLAEAVETLPPLERAG